MPQLLCGLLLLLGLPGSTLVSSEVLMQGAVRGAHQHSPLLPPP